MLSEQHGKISKDRVGRFKVAGSGLSLKVYVVDDLAAKAAHVVTVHAALDVVGGRSQVTGVDVGKPDVFSGVEPALLVENEAGLRITDSADRVELQAIWLRLQVGPDLTASPVVLPIEIAANALQLF